MRVEIGGHESHSVAQAMHQSLQRRDERLEEVVKMVVVNSFLHSLDLPAAKRLLTIQETRNERSVAVGLKHPGVCRVRRRTWPKLSGAHGSPRAPIHP